jgi:hypothetical protein
MSNIGVIIYYNPENKWMCLIYHPTGIIRQNENGDVTDASDPKGARETEV